MPPKDPISIAEFAAKVKEKYPEYKDIDDTLLTQRVIEKYPEYKDKVNFQVKPTTASSPIPSLQQQSPNIGIAPVGTYKQDAPKPFNMKEYLEGKPQDTPQLQPNKTVKVGKSNPKPDVKEAIDRAVVNENNKYGAQQPDMNFKRDEITAKVKQGDLIPDFDANGNSVLKTKTGLFDSFFNAVNKAAIDRADNANLASMSNDDKIKYLEAKRVIDAKNEDNTKAAGVLGKTGEFLGENADMLAKTAVGAMTGGTLAPELVGAGHMGGFLATVKDFTDTGYGNTLQKTYSDLRAQGVPEKEAMEQAHKAGLVGAATSIGAGAALAGIPKLQAGEQEVHGFINSLIKNSGKMGAVSGAQAGVNDLAEIGVGVHKDAKDVINDIGENAANGAAVGAAFEAMLNIHKLPKALMEQATELVASIPVEQREALLTKAVDEGSLPTEKADEIRSMVSVVRPEEINKPETTTIAPKENEFEQTNKPAIILPENNKEPNIIEVGKTNNILSPQIQENESSQAEGSSNAEAEGQEKVAPQNEQPTIPQEGEPLATVGEEGSQEPPVEPPKAETLADGKASEPVGITHAQTDKLAEELGLPDRYEKAPTTREAQNIEAADRIAKGEMPSVIEKLKKGEMPSDVEQRMMAYHLGELKAEYESTKSDATLLKIKELKELSDVVGGREVGRSLQARHNEWNVHPLEGGEASAKVAVMEALGVDKLTPNQHAEIEKQVSEYKARAEKAEAATEAIQKKYDDFVAEQELNKTKKTANRKPKTKEQFATERKAIVDSIKDKWNKAANDGTLTAVPIPYAKQLAAIAPDVAKLLKSLVEEGVDKLDDVVKNIHGIIKEGIPELTERDVRDIIAGKYNEKKETKTDLQAKIFDLKQEQKLLDELDSEVAKKPKTEKDTRIRNERLAELRKRIGEKRLAELAADKHAKRLSELNDELERVRKRKEKEPAPKGEPKKVSQEEQEVLDKINAEQETWDSEKDAARRSKREYQKLETERNRQLKRVGELKDKLANLQRGELPEGKPSQPKEDTPEIEALKKEIADAEKSVRENIAHQKKMDALEAELQRIKDRSEREKKPEKTRVVSDEEKRIRAEIETEQQAWDIEKNIEKLNAELQRVKDRKVKVTDPKAKRELTDVEKNIVSQIKSEKEAWAKEVEPARKLAQAVKSTEKAIADLEDRLAKGDSSGKPKSTISTSPELTALKKKKEGLQEQMEALRKVNGDIDLKKIKSTMNSNASAMQKLEKRIADKDFAEMDKRVPFTENFEFQRKYPVEYKEALNAIKAKEEKQKEFDLAVLKDQMANRTKFEKLKDEAVRLKNTSTAIVAGVDNSLAFVQLGYTLGVNPSIAVNFKKVEVNGKDKVVLGGAIKEQVLDAWSKERFERKLQELHQSKFWPIIQASGLDILEPMSLMDKKHEELFQHNLADKVGIGTIDLGKKLSLGDSKLKSINAGKFLAIWERAYTSLGNNTRVALFLREAAKLQEKGMTIQNSLEEYKGLARSINNLTGRGSINSKIAPAVPALTFITGIWSPKMLASSLNLLGVSEVMGTKGGFYSKLPPEARKFALKQVAAGFSIGIGALAAAAVGGHTVHYDPRDPRFGDIEYGENNSKSINVFLRFASVMKLIAQMTPFIGGVKKDGVVTSIYDKGGKTGMQEIGGFVRGKMNPIYGLAYDYALNDKTGYFDKKPITATSTVQNLAVPMSLRNVGDLLKHDGTMEWYEFLANFHGLPMKNQDEFFDNKFTDTPAGKFLQKNRIKLPEPEPTIEKDDDHPSGKMTDDEAKKFTSIRDEVMKKALAEAIRQNRIVPGVDSKVVEQNQDEVDRLSKKATIFAKKKIFGSNKMTPEEKREMRMNRVGNKLFDMKVFKN